MELKDKLQQLRKQKGLTQEELAQKLYVSRAAVSKWESGRGYPSIDSLKAIADYFSVTVDELLSCEEVLTIAREDRKERENRLRDLVFGLLDCGAAMLLFLPLFGEKRAGFVAGVSLLSLPGVAAYMKTVFITLVVTMAAMGILTLALQNSRRSVWVQNKGKLSIVLNAVGALLFILSQQPYPAVFLFVFLAIKGSMLIK